jgi:hypothetical protein
MPSQSLKLRACYVCVPRLAVVAWLSRVYYLLSWDKQILRHSRIFLPLAEGFGGGLSWGRDLQVQNPIEPYPYHCLLRSLGRDSSSRGAWFRTTVECFFSFSYYFLLSLHLPPSPYAFYFFFSFLNKSMFPCSWSNPDEAAVASNCLCSICTCTTPSHY